MTRGCILSGLFIHCGIFGCTRCIPVSLVRWRLPWFGFAGRFRSWSRSRSPSSSTSCAIGAIFLFMAGFATLVALADRSVFRRCAVFRDVAVFATIETAFTRTSA